MEHVEALVNQGVLWFKLAVELVGVVIIGIGCIMAVMKLAWTWRGPSTTFTGVRLLLARYLALGLEFQLAGDILATAIAPSWEEIGKLAAIAAIRTVLNVFLAREMAEERAKERAERSEGPDGARARQDHTVELADRVVRP